jgi:hypothetical protein
MIGRQFLLLNSPRSGELLRSQRQGRSLATSEEEFTRRRPEIRPSRVLEEKKSAKQLFLVL